MKTELERQQLINDIVQLLNQAYDSTLDEVYAFLKKIEDDDEDDLKAYDDAKEDIRINGTVPWEKVSAF